MSDSEDDVPLAKRAFNVAAGSNKGTPALSNGGDTSDNDSDMPLSARIKSKETIADDDSDEDMPLAKRLPLKMETTSESEVNGSANSKRRAQESDSDSDEPLSKRVPQPPKRKKTGAENGSVHVKKEDMKAKKATKPQEASQAHSRELSIKKEIPEQKPSKSKKTQKEEEDEEHFKWWEQQENLDSDGSTKWETLEHAGVLFPPEYQPHGVKMKYDGKPITLTPEAEEVASFFAALLGSDHAQNPTFCKNFFADWQQILRKSPQNPVITDFKKCDFTPIYEYFEKEKGRKKQMTKQEKQEIKEAKAKQEEKFAYAIVDGRKEKVGNFRIEPPGLFRGRGEHPKTGCLKTRVKPEQITLNLGENAPIPAPPPGHKWGGIVHDQTATWLATWKENVNGSIKYVFLAATSMWKGQSDMQKFEKARELKKHVAKIRRDYTAELKDKVMATRQRATALYLIDRLALRAGNEKGDEEADTVGCCSLRCEHVTLEPPNVVIFDFLGKDSIRYHNSVEVDTQVFKNLKIFKKEPKTEEDMLFDRLTTTTLNKHLSSYMKGLTAKVFRTYNASYTFQEQLKATNPDDTVAEKLLTYNRANRAVAILCNHQRAVSKGHAGQMLKIEDKVKALKYQRMKLRKMILAIDPKLKKREDLTEVDPDLTDEWIIEHEKQNLEKEKQKAEAKFAKDNEKRIETGETLLSEKDLKLIIKDIEAKYKDLEEERKSGKVEPKKGATVEKLEAQIEKIEERIKNVELQMVDKEENKETALTTSKINYIDPRISAAWCHKYDVPLEKVFSKTLRDKFKWAMTVDGSWTF